MKIAVIVISALGCSGCLWPSAVFAGGPDLSKVLANEDEVGRLREIVPYVKSLSPEEVPGALKQAIAGHGSGRIHAIDALSGRWVELDAPAALAFARQTSDLEARDSIESAYYGAWAEHDPDGALKAANQVDAAEYSKAIWQIAHKIGPRDPQRANELIRSVHFTKMPDSDYFIFWNWAGSNLEQANQKLLQEAKVPQNHSYPCEAAVWAMTDRLVEDDPKAAVNWVAQLPPGKIHDEGFDRLISEWVKIDPNAVATWLKSSPDSDQVRTAIMNLPKTNPTDALLSVKADPAFARKADEWGKILVDSNSWTELEALLPFVDGLTATEFPQALDRLRNAQDSNRDTLLNVLVERWSKIDPEGAIKAIPVTRTIHDMEFRDLFLCDIYAAWAQRDPEATFANATRDYHGVGNFRVLSVIFAALARQDPAKAYATFLKLNDANSHMLVIPIFTEWAVRDLPAATKALSHETHSDGTIEGMVVGLMRKGPAAAIAWAEHLPVKANRDRALQDVALRWPDDPAAAMAWLQKEPAFDGKNSAFLDAAVDWVNRDPTEALHHAVTLADGKEKDLLLYYGLAELTYTNAQASQRFVQQLPDGKMKKDARATVLSYWSEYAPKAAADYLASIPTEATANDVACVAGALSDGDPLSAVHWLESLPASADKSQAIGKIAGNWYRTDPSATISWVNQMPAGPSYDAGAQGICGALNADLSPALKWARSIGDSKTRHDAVYHAFEVATYSLMKFGMWNESQVIKDDIRGAPELTDAEKNALIARVPTLVINQYPQPLKKPELPSNH